MIDPASYPFYLSYAAITAILFVMYLKVKSTEPIIITTKEFRKFQSTYLLGYALSLLVKHIKNYYTTPHFTLLTLIRCLLGRADEQCLLLLCVFSILG